MTPTIEERVHRVKVALAEMGWGHVAVEWREKGDGGTPAIWGLGSSPPSALLWTVWHVAGEAVGCWGCWSTGDPQVMDQCADHGNCAHPEGPAKPPRELLVAP